MKIALISDLHGNLPATLAVEADIRKRGADVIYCLGDLIGKGPDSPETMDWAFANCDVILMGNWDDAVMRNQFAFNPLSCEWYRAQLGDERLRNLAQLPLEHYFYFSGRKIRLVHGRPLLEDVVFYDSPVEERTQFFTVPDAPQIVCFADIHQPFYEQIDEYGILINVGSVGNPLAHQPYATYCLLEGEMGDKPAPLAFTIIQVDYDREEAVRRTLATPGLPKADAFIKEIRSGIYSR